MGRRDRVPACLPRLVLMFGCLAAAMIWWKALPAWAQNPPAAGASAASRAAQTARTTSLDDRQPPPGPITISQIHNAPGWQPSHTYTYATGPATRIVSGAGWNPTSGKFEPGQTLGAYQLTSTGNCTSASSGGPGGNGSSIQDGTCTWKYLSNVDYISITGWAFDNRPWKGGTLYHLIDYVVSDSPLRAYVLTGDSCTSTVARWAPAAKPRGRSSRATAANGNIRPTSPTPRGNPIFRQRRASRVVGCSWCTRATKRSFGTIGNTRLGETVRRRRSAYRITTTTEAKGPPSSAAPHHATTSSSRRRLARAFRESYVLRSPGWI